MSDLHLIKRATGDFSNDLSELFQHFSGILSVMQPIESYYSLDSIKSLLKTRADTVPYQTVAQRRTPLIPPIDVDLRSEDGTLVNETVPATPAEPIKTGMKVEFRNVSFRYPHAKKPALDNVSFTIYPGEVKEARLEVGVAAERVLQLVSIVGFSGSGKSTLIALLTRWAAFRAT